ncbi:formin-binding protein 1 homolog isoform X9 [Haplochromis burtoni]|uniref:formin-binding protein 1 homolog isoform X9 n=1 Tax=Haplochromis burtoni TaxID=8153 RepID=UPI0006C9594D|nr:formin-binding protein 1 homolog isoform X9 [Haplochromis burtoni]
MKTVTMLRRRSEFFVFLDSALSVITQKEEQKEEPPLSPSDEYLQVLLQMKTTSADQFDNLEKHTQWGIEFVEKYTKFVKERSEIETNYAKQIRNLSKKYQPKKNSKEEEESKYTFCRAFLTTLNELNDYAGQHEVISENLTSLIITELARYLQELKTERKSHFHDGRKAQQHIESSWKQLEASKKRFERECKEAERAQQYFEKMDADINVTKADVEKRSFHKARQQAQMRHQMASDSKSEYAAYLEKFNKEQNEHYYTIIPNIFQKLQDMEEKRIERISVCMKTFADVDRQVLPIVGKCLDGMTNAAESIEPKADSKQVVESFKSGFEPPGDVEFEDYGQAMKRTVSETSLSNTKESKEKPGVKAKSKLWPFIKNKNKLMSLLTSPHQPPPAPPASSPPSPSAVPNDPQSPKQHKEPLSHRLNDFMASKPKMHCLRSLRRGITLNSHVRNLIEGSVPEDFSHLPPEQRRKKLQGKIDELSKDIQKEMDQRDALTKMKDVYIKNPQMGDPASVDPRLTEIGQNIEKLQSEVQKFEGWLAEVEERMPSKSDSHRKSGLYETQNSTTVSNNCAQDRERPLSSPDGSYTEEQNSEVQVKAQPIPTPTTTTEFDDEFDDEEVLPTIGTCKALYPFEGHNEGTISVAEGELLYVIEEDKGDGWTRVRRNEDEEGYVPTSYVEVFLETNAKGAMTYI